MLQDHPHAHEAREYATRNDATANAAARPLPTEPDVLTDLLRPAAKQLPAQAIPAELSAYLEARAHLRDEAGHRHVVRNGALPQRTTLTGIGPVEVQQPRGPDRRPADQREKFTRAILPPYLRQTKRAEELTPWLHRKGVRAGDFAEARAALLGPDAQGLSANTLTRLKAVGQQEYEAGRPRPLAGKPCVSVWAGGVDFNLRLEEGRQCILVLLGATADGRKELLALRDGYRESEHSWEALRLDGPARGRSVAPTRAVGDGALGFGKVLRPVFPTTKEQRCRAHQTANVLDQLPQGQQPKAQVLAHDLGQAETKAAAAKAFDLFVAPAGAKSAPATDCLVEDREERLVFDDFPALPGLPRRTTNPIASTFATVRRRTSKPQGSGSRSAGRTMAFQLLESAAKRWRLWNGSPRLAKGIAGVRLVDGVEQTNAA